MSNEVQIVPWFFSNKGNVCQRNMAALVSFGCYNWIPKIGGLNNIYFSQPWRPEVRDQGGTWFMMKALFLVYWQPCLRIVSSHGGERKGKLSSSFIEDTNSIMRAPFSSLNYLPKVATSNTLTLGLQTMNLGGANIQSIAIALSIRGNKTQEPRVKA